MLSFVCVNDGEIKKNNIFAYLSKTNTVNNELITHSGGKDGKDIVGNDPSLSVSF